MRYLRFLIAVLIVLSFTSFAFAQQTTPEGGSVLERALAWFLGQASVVTVIVSALKRYPFVRSHPKATAAILNAVAIMGADLLYGIIPGQGFDDVLVKLLASVAAAFASSGAYEYVLKPGITVVMPPKS